MFARQTINGIQQWINSCQQNNGSPVNHYTDIASVQEPSIDIWVAKSNSNNVDSPVMVNLNNTNVNSPVSVNSGDKLLEKNAQKKQQWGNGELH